ncbi:serine hydrolase domain-containing protein [Amycolatopsis sp. cg5]|uniref:serine hydrolase domain-containing protein n=1 Tax=Amycolatopsis sp. cg5 TaxID=3238802 RepID=UPI0035246A3E
MRRTSILIAALCAATVTSTGVAAASPGSALQRDADAVVADGSPGVLAELSTPRGKTKVRSGYGDLERESPVPWNAHFRIASFTKTFVSATILQLTAEGRLSLEDTVDRWLPGVVAGNGNDGRAITVRQLLQHTSGLYDYLLDLPWLEDEKGFLEHRYDKISAPEAAKMAVSHAPNFQPGARWEYSNTNYVVAGMVIEKVTGRSWRREVTDRIIRPLGMQETSAPGTSPRIPAPHARGYHRFPVAGTNELGDWVDVTSLNPAAGGGADGELISTTEDGNKFLQALMTGKVLKPAQLAEMKKTVPVSDKAGYGLGLAWTATSCGGYWGHGGGWHGFATGSGVTENGKRSVMVTVNTVTPRTDSEHPGDPINTLIERALCDG